MRVAAVSKARPRVKLRALRVVVDADVPRSLAHKAHQTCLKLLADVLLLLPCVVLAGRGVCNHEVTFRSTNLCHLLCRLCRAHYKSRERRREEEWRLKLNERK